jgi:hypothetical protein
MAFSQNYLTAPKAHPERVKQRDDEKRRQPSQCLSRLRVLRERSRRKKMPQRLNIRKIGGFGKKARKFLFEKPCRFSGGAFVMSMNNTKKLSPLLMFTFLISRFTPYVLRFTF